MNSLTWKVCGLRDSTNIIDISRLNPDILGFIFYTRSPRYAIPDLDIQTIDSLSASIKKAGVFVNEENKNILDICRKYRLDYIQLHGTESSSYCKNLKDEGFGIIKAFSINENFNFSSLSDYIGSVDLILFDTKGDLPGGNSFPFDWELLNNYRLDIPFMLSGGISLENFPGINKIQHPKLTGIDVNSRFEISPGLKDVEKLKALKKLMNELD